MLRPESLAFLLTPSAIRWIPPAIGSRVRHVSVIGSMHDDIDWRHVNRCGRIIAEATTPRSAIEVTVAMPFRDVFGANTRGNEPAEVSSTLPLLDFLTDPEVVRVVAEGERLAYAHLFNPAFATEISMIDPLPHQRTRSMTTCCPSLASAFSWEMSRGRARPSWPGSTSVRCSPDVSCDEF